MNKELLLEKYFEQSLTKEEEKEFEELISSDDEFAATFKFEKELKKAIGANERADLKRKLKSYEEVESKKLIPTKWFYAAACFIAIIGFSLWFILLQNSNENLYQTYYQAYPNTIAPTVRGAQTEEIKTQAFFAYDNGDYANSAKLFEQIYTTEKLDFALLYQAVSLMELKDYKKAEETFKKYDYQENTSLTPYFKWYLALTELQTNNKARAKISLQELSETANPMQEMAKKLLADLN